MTFFYFKFFLTSIVFSLIIGGVMMRWNKENKYTAAELVLYALGLGPVFTVLLLYYLFLAVPGKEYIFYIVIILAVYAALAFIGFKGLRRIFQRARDFIKDKKAARRELSSKEKIKRAVYPLIVIILLGVFLVTFVGNTLQTPIEGHDALIYGNFGQLYAYRCQIRYVKVMTVTFGGFVFTGSQKPSFSLLLTWEMMLNGKEVNQNKDYQFDLFFRSISGFYGLLIAAVVFLWLYRKNKFLSLAALVVMVSGLRFMLMIVDYHLDSYRIFFLLMSWIWLGYTIKHKDNLSLFLLGIFSGFTAFAHPIGLLAALFNIIAFLLFDERPFKTRMVNTLWLGLIILACGNIHYPLEIIFGSVSGYLTYI